MYIHTHIMILIIMSVIISQACRYREYYDQPQDKAGCPLVRQIHLSVSHFCGFPLGLSPRYR